MKFTVFGFSLLDTGFCCTIFISRSKRKYYFFLSKEMYELGFKLDYNPAQIQARIFILAEMQIMLWIIRYSMTSANSDRSAFGCIQLKSLNNGSRLNLYGIFDVEKVMAICNNFVSLFVKSDIRLLRIEILQALWDTLTGHGRFLYILLHSHSHNFWWIFLHFR